MHTYSRINLLRMTLFFIKYYMDETFLHSLKKLVI